HRARRIRCADPLALRHAVPGVALIRPTMSGNTLNGSAVPVLPLSHMNGQHNGQTLRYQVHVLRRRWWLVALVTVAVIAGAWWRSRDDIPQYTPTAQMQKQPDRDLLEAGWAGFYDLTPEAVTAQIEIIKGQDVLYQVVDSVGARLVLSDPAVSRHSVINYVKVTPDARSALYSIRRAGNEFQLLDAG